MNELMINLNNKKPIPLYEQIYQSIKEDIQNGKIRSGEKLPSTRVLSKYLEVSRSTVELAYEQLLSEGYIEAEPCKGFFVAQIEELYRLAKLNRPISAKVPTKEIIYKYDFSPRGIDLNSFPYGAWRKISKDVLLDDKMELFHLGDSQGEYTFRSAICNYLYQARGVNCSPEHLIVGAGNDYLLMLLGTIIGPNHKIAFENPTYKQAYRLFERLSYEVCTVDMDEKGMQVSQLRSSGADMAYVMPSHQYPLGIVMPIKRRMELMKWANEEPGRYIIEDDYDSEFRYKGKPIPALQGHDGNDRIIYLGTFSKSIAPAIRMSYMVLPQELLEVYREKCKFVSSTVSKVDQLIVERFLEDGYYERHLNKMRAMYKNRHDTLMTSIKLLQDICTISGEHAGVHLLLTFHNGMSEEELIEQAKKKSVRVYGLSEYYTDKSKAIPSTVLLGYANLSESFIQEAIALLAQAWN
ncbi:MocR-like pyridoxine biosynthesis transcription factor PdxR [Lachnospiraceae bacterium LCP25S3_G4]